VVLCYYGWKDALMVSVIRCLIAFFFHGSLVALVLSTSGGIMSVLLMSLLFKWYPRYFSIKCISICGALMHNIAQITVAMLIVKTSFVFMYLPYLLIVGVISGYGIGVISKHFCKMIDANIIRFQNKKTIDQI
jgi:heptaprenyl diphosphate synthase